jgi:hypothetical protein
MSNESSSSGLSAIWTAALVGALTRPIVVFAFWHSGGKGGYTWLSILITSSIVGMLVGLASGSVAQSSSSLRSPWAGPLFGGLTGALLSLGSSFVTVVFLCMATYNPRGNSNVNFQLYLGVMSLVGALPGIWGGLVANLARWEFAAANRLAELRSIEGHPSPDRNADRKE